jgi:phosphoglycolate phosphatase
MDNSLKNKFDSIIFDLDGTLWDSTANVAEAWQAAKNAVDYIDLDFTIETVRSITGMAYNAIFEKLLPLVNEEQRADFKSIASVKEIELLQLNGGHLYPRLQETLEYLSAKYKLFVVSNCQSNYIETFLDFSQLGHYFQGHQCYGTKGQPKAENIKDVVNNHGLTAPVYVGDTTGDYESSTKAGVPFIFASYGFGVVETGQIATIDTLAELTELL